MCNGKSKCGSNWNKNQTEEVVYFLTSLIPQEVSRAGTHHP